MAKKDKQDKQDISPHDLISNSEIKQIHESLITTDADLVVRGITDKDARAELESVVAKQHKAYTKNNMDVVKHVVREIVGTGVVEDILQDESITDIGYNGSELIVESNDNKQVYDTNFEITESYIVSLVNKFANTNNKEFTSKNPVLDGRFENVRINAVHSQNTAPESGTTMSLRVVRPKLALTKDNFEGFAPMFIYDLLRASALAKMNMVISGTTGTGKTELHKLISGFIPFDDRILLIEDTPETFMKQMFPEKDVYSWVTTEGVGVTELIKAGLRNQPAWLMVTETRGSEAYEMIQAVLSGHSIITSLHATEARAIPSRFVNMAKMGYEVSEDALKEDIHNYFNFGIHIKKVRYHGHVVRYLSEMIEFTPEGSNTVFKQRFVDGVFYFETFELSQAFWDVLEELMIDLDFPSNFKSERPLNTDHTTFQATIPLDASGRPDMAKIHAMGTTIEELMGGDKPEDKPVHHVQKDYSDQNDDDTSDKPDDADETESDGAGDSRSDHHNDDGDASDEPDKPDETGDSDEAESVSQHADEQADTEAEPVSRAGSEALRQAAARRNSEAAMKRKKEKLKRQSQAESPEPAAPESPGPKDVKPSPSKPASGFKQPDKAPDPSDQDDIMAMVKRKRDKIHGNTRGDI